MERSLRISIRGEGGSKEKKNCPLFSVFVSSSVLFFLVLFEKSNFTSLHFIFHLSFFLSFVCTIENTFQ